MTLVDPFLILRGYTIKCANILVLLAYLANVTTSASQKENFAQSFLHRAADCNRISLRFLAFPQIVQFFNATTVL